MLILALLACGPPELTFAKGVCAASETCDVPLGSNIVLEPLLGGEPADRIEIESSASDVLATGKSANKKLALWRTVKPGASTLTLRAHRGADVVERSWEVEVHAIADLGLQVPTELQPGETLRIPIRPRNAAGEDLVWDWLFLDQGEPDLLCVPPACSIHLSAGTYALWNGESAEPVQVIVP